MFFYVLEHKKTNSFSELVCNNIGARDGNRTHTILLPADFESAASTSSATLAVLFNYNIISF